MNAVATQANINLAKAADPSINIPSWYAAAAAAGDSSATIGRALRPFPQYSGPPSVTWDNIANLSYNAPLQSASSVAVPRGIGLMDAQARYTLAICATRMMRCATNSSTPPRAASGTCASSRLRISSASIRSDSA